VFRIPVFARITNAAIPERSAAIEGAEVRADFNWQRKQSNRSKKPPPTAVGDGSLLCTVTLSPEGHPKD
jgi:hypothetical protein